MFKDDEEGHLLGGDGAMRRDVKDETEEEARGTFL